MSEHWQQLIATSEFPAVGKYAVKVGGWHVFVARTDDGWVAFSDRCTHQASMLSGGRIRRGAIMCPLHGARFDLASGECLGGTYRDLRRFPLRVKCDMIEVSVPTALPGMDEIPVPI